jgi:hypothetical protein
MDEPQTKQKISGRTVLPEQPIKEQNWALDVPLLHLLHLQEKKYLLHMLKTSR